MNLLVVKYTNPCAIKPIVGNICKKRAIVLRLLILEYPSGRAVLSAFLAVGQLVHDPFRMEIELNLVEFICRIGTFTNRNVSA